MRKLIVALVAYSVLLAITVPYRGNSLADSVRERQARQSTARPAELEIAHKHTLFTELVLEEYLSYESYDPYEWQSRRAFSIDTLSACNPRVVVCS